MVNAKLHPKPSDVTPYEMDLLKAATPIVGSTQAAGGSWGDTLFQTSYDVQTNASMQNRIFISSNGDVSVISTADEPGAGGGPNRNIGYRRYDATAQTWGPAEYPIRSNRCGWPSICSDDNNDRVFSHTPQYMNSRATPGTGTWAEDTTTQILGGTFSNSYGSVGNYVHHVIPGAVNGKAGFLYSRSTDGGVTWDKLSDTTVADLATSLWTAGDGEGVWAEGMNVVQRGPTVAITTGGQGSVMLFKSTDNGDSWNVIRVTTLDTTGITRDVDGAGDEINYCFDNMMSTSIDVNGMVHIAAATGAYGSGATDYNWLGYYATLGKGLAYWNESMGPDFNTLDSVDMAALRLLTYVDEDGDGEDGTPGVLDSIGNYYTHGPVASPAISLGDNGEVVIHFTAVREDLVGLGVLMDGNDGKKGPGSDVYAIASFDGGNTWNATRNVCDEVNGTIASSWVEEDYYLYAWPWIVGNSAHVVWQSDDYLDAQWNSTSPGVVQSYIVHYPTDVTLLGLKEDVVNNVDMGVYPNPANNLINIDLDLRTDASYEVVISNMLGQSVVTENVDLNAGGNVVTLDVNNLNAGIYLVSVRSGQNAVSTKVVIE